MLAAKLPETFIPLALVVEGVAGFFGIPVSRLRSAQWSTSLNCARQIAALLMLDHSICSQTEIGAALGRRSETAGRDFIKAGRARLEKDQRFGELLEQARKLVSEGVSHV